MKSISQFVAVSLMPAVVSGCMCMMPMNDKIISTAIDYGGRWLWSFFEVALLFIALQLLRRFSFSIRRQLFGNQFLAMRVNLYSKRINSLPGITIIHDLFQGVMNIVLHGVFQFFQLIPLQWHRHGRSNPAPQTVG